VKTFSRFLYAALVVLLVQAAPVYGEGGPDEVKKVVATVDQDGVQRVAILGGGYFYDPNYIVVKVNVPVELSLQRESGMTPHDFVIKAPEAGIDVSVSLDTKPQLVTFTPTKTGTYPFICTKKLLFFKSHQDKGMEGTLEVTE